VVSENQLNNFLLNMSVELQRRRTDHEAFTITLVNTRSRQPRHSQTVVYVAFDSRDTDVSLFVAVGASYSRFAVHAAVATVLCN